MGTLGTNTCGGLTGTLGSGVVSFYLALACFFSLSLIALCIALSIVFDIVSSLLICDSYRRGDRCRSSIGGAFVDNRGFGLDGVDQGSSGAKLVAMPGCCAVMRFVTSANCCKSRMLTPFFMALVVAPFVMILSRLARRAIALMIGSV